MKTFEDFLMDKFPFHLNNSNEAFEKWLSDIDIDALISYADEYKNKSLTNYHNHIVEKVREKRKKEDFTKTYCPECGGHYAAGECDCAGYNKAIDDFISQLQDTNK